MAQAGYELLLNFIFSKKSHKYNKVSFQKLLWMSFPPCLQYSAPKWHSLLVLHSEISEKKKPIQLWVSCEKASNPQ